MNDTSEARSNSKEVEAPHAVQTPSQPGRPHRLVVPIAGIRRSAGYIMLLSLFLEAVPGLRLAVQTLPPAVVISILAFPLTLWRPLRGTPASVMLTLFFGWAFFASALGVAFAFGTRNWPAHFAGLVRQLGSLLLGGAFYIAVRQIAAEVPPRRLFRLVLIGSGVSLAVAALAAAGLILRDSHLFSLVVRIREFAVPMGAYGVPRVAGLSSEPSHYVFFIAALLVPCLVASGKLRALGRKALLVYWIVALLTAALASSGSGMAALTVAAAVVAFVGHPRIGVTLVAVGALLTVGLFIGDPSNYLVSQVQQLVQGDPSASFTTRFYSTVGPLLVSLSPEGLIGAGLGGTVSRLYTAVPASVAEALLESSWEDVVALKTLWGKLLTETGLIGAILFGLFIVFAARQALRARAILGRESESGILSAAAASGVLISAGSQAIGFGAYTFPFLWFWAGVADACWALAQRVGAKAAAVAGAGAHDSLTVEDDETAVLENIPVTAIVVNWCSLHETMECVDSLLSMRHPMLRVVVVDNASPDGSGQALVERYGNVPRVRVIRNSTNLGFGAAVNQAFQTLTPNMRAYLLLVNPDARVPQSTIRRLLRIALEDRQVAAVGPTIVYSADPDRVWHGGAYFNRIRAMITVPSKDLRVRSVARRRPIDVEVLTGCVMVLRAEAFEAVGGFDTAFFLYEEDVDLSLRLIQAGYRVVWVPMAVAYHNIRPSLRVNDQVFYHRARSHVLLIRKHYTGLSYGYAIALHLTLLTLARALQAAAARNLAAASAWWLGTRDGLREARSVSPVLREGRAKRGNGRPR